MVGRLLMRAWPTLGTKQAEHWICLASSVGTLALGLLSQTLLWLLAPRRDGTQVSVPGASSQLFIDRPDFFDYPDSDKASLLAVAQFIGEKPITFVKTGSSPGLFQHLLVGTLVVAFFFLLFQFCMHVRFQKGA
ncbi:fertilization-influencing membrane protein isoform X1 [Arvicanthis niloticus]|uniref:fertilization-influencing membrane protein isoform X1 n=1 Tax=Arvicanthis niloticus TaxID=61156 RepID=UPI00402B89C8